MLSGFLKMINTGAWICEFFFYINNISCFAVVLFLNNGVFHTPTVYRLLSQIKSMPPLNVEKRMNICKQFFFIRGLVFVKVSIFVDNN